MASLLAEQAGACAMCSRALDDTEFHLYHRVARSAFGSDAQANLQLICVNCHEGKTSEETLRLGVEDSCPLLSRFNIDTWAAFVESAKPHQLVADLHKPREGDALEFDVVRCRLAAYTHANAHPLCVFSPFDEIVPAQAGRLGDHTWVDLGTPRSLRRALPYWGPGWYGKSHLRIPP